MGAEADAPDEAFTEHALIQKARDQVEHGFPLLWEQATVSLWSHLEVATEDLAVALVEHALTTDTLDALSVEARTVRLPVEVWVQGNRRDHARQVLAELDKKQHFGTKPGAGQLEATLEVVGLGGGVSDDIRRALLQTSQVRHVLVHRGGEADERFVEYCSDLVAGVGSRVSVDEGTFRDWSEAAESYMVTVAQRVADRQPHLPRPAAAPSS